MTTKTISERIVDAYHTGREAVFHTNDIEDTGDKYEFTPAGLVDFIGDTGGYVTPADLLTQQELVSVGTEAITIPAGSTLDQALQIIIDAIDPEEG